MPVEASSGAVRASRHGAGSFEAAATPKARSRSNSVTSGVGKARRRSNSVTSAPAKARGRSNSVTSGVGTTRSRSSTVSGGSQAYGVAPNPLFCQAGPPFYQSAASSVNRSVRSERSLTRAATTAVKGLMTPSFAFQEVSDPQASRAWRPRHLMGMGITRSIDRVSLAMDEGLACHKPREQARTLVNSRLFALLSCTAILSHSAVIGMEQARCLRGAPSGDDFTSAKYAIVGFYALELLLHAFGHGVADVCRNRVRLVDALILCAFLSSEAALSGYPRPRDSPLLLRILRLLPLFRIMEAIDSFGFVRVLTRAFWPSTGVMCHAMVLLILLFYILSVIGVDIVGMHRDLATAGVPAEVRDIVNSYFSSVPASMLTLVQFVCLDTIGAIYRPLVVNDAGLVLYFLAVVVIVPVVLMKLVTGEIFRIMQDHMEKERDKEQLAAKSALAKELQEVFSRLDEDRSGQISLEEIMHISCEDREVLNNSTHLYDPVAIFHALDPDQTGNLDIHTFCDGVWTLATHSVRIQEHQAQNHVSSIFRRLEGLEASQAKLGASLGRALALQRGLQKTLSSEDAGWLKAAGDQTLAEVQAIGL